MQAWCTSPVWLVWQGAPLAETTGLTDIGFVILRLEVLPFRTSFFFNGLWLFICQAVYGRPNDWQQCWSWGCIKLQKQQFYYFIWFHLSKEEKKLFWICTLIQNIIIFSGLSYIITIWNGKHPRGTYICLILSILSLLVFSPFYFVIK